MSISKDEQLESQTAGTADWDAGLNANFTIQERGNHVTVPAGMAINTGHVCWIDSGGFAHHFDPNSLDIHPHGYSFTGASSGADVQLVVRGTIRSLDINSGVVAGINAYVSGSTPGAVVNSYSGSRYPIGWGTGASQLYFDPNLAAPAQRITQAFSHGSILESMHLFELDMGGYGWIRDTTMLTDSGDLMRLWFYSDSARSGNKLLFEVTSGGVDATSAGDFGGYHTSSGWPFENTDASTINGLIYGTVEVHSLGSVNSVTLEITLTGERR